MAQVDLVNVSKSYPDGTPAVTALNLSINSGEFVCVLGPSGCGKSSTLRMIAGLEEVSAGEIRIDGRNVVRTPPRERDIAMVFENYALYPHLDVYRNIAMPLVARRRPEDEIRKRVGEIAGVLDITALLKMLPKRLSGGQRQRVALARAMIRRPRMFLMDEPLGHLEAYMRVELRREIRRLHEVSRGTTFYITHDQQEAAAISDRIAVMSAGKLQQYGPLRELLDQPVNRFVAEFVGEPPINIFENVSWADGALQFPGMRLPVDDSLRARLSARSGAGTMAVGIRPKDLALVSEGDAGSHLPIVVTSVQPMGEWSALIGESPAGPVRAVIPAADAPKEGAPARLAVLAERVQVFDASGANLRVTEGRRNG